MTGDQWQRVKEIFHAARELAAVEREEYLSELAESDAPLRPEVEKMLRHSTGAGPLDRPAWEGVGTDRILQPGDRLGPYEVLSEVGSGGMGRVYKAIDTRLERTVAIKVVNAEFSHRLRIEGRAISALNHPHVCALYDIDDREGYLVMEYVDGESLAARLRRGPLPIEAALRYGAEIADALAAAHAHGIVHRDLKPANIMITSSGAKVLDFGVAKTAQEEPAGGTMAGTAAYMSPSQLNGNPADARSDIFALGLVLYEMAMGRRYSGGQVKWPATVPSGLAALIERCLRRESASRVQHMEEVRFALDRLRAEGTGGRTRRHAFAPGVLMAVIFGIAVSALVWNFARPPAPPEVTFSQAAPPAAIQPSPAPIEPKVERAIPVRQDAAAPPALVTLGKYPGLERDPALSPNGRAIAFSWHVNRPGYGIYVRSVEGNTPPTELTDGTSEDWGSAWSPDGRSLAFRRKGAPSGIYRIAASGGDPRFIAPLAHWEYETLPQVSWSHDGKWIAAPDRDSTGAFRIYLFDAASGAKRAITSDTAATDHAPAFSPNGKSLAYASCLSSVVQCDVYVVDLTAELAPKGVRRITAQGIFIRGIAWLPGGRSLIYSAAPRHDQNTELWRVDVNPPGLPQRIDMAGKRVRHPTIAPIGSLLAYTNMDGWRLMMIKNFR